MIYENTDVHEITCLDFLFQEMVSSMELGVLATYFRAIQEL
jgi:hypothetical protein